MDIPKDPRNHSRQALYSDLISLSGPRNVPRSCQQGVTPRHETGSPVDGNFRLFGSLAFGLQVIDL